MNHLQQLIELPVTRFFLVAGILFLGLLGTALGSLSIQKNSPWPLLNDQGLPLLWIR